MDPASSEFYRDGRYHLRTESASLSAEEMTIITRTLLTTFGHPAEDGLAEDDWSGWKHLHQALGDRVELVGDDIFVTT